MPLVNSENESEYSPWQKPMPIYFAVSPSKFAVMSIFTFNIYTFYWFYQVWIGIQAQSREEIRPFWRTFFAFFYCHALVSNINATAQECRAGGPLNEGWITAGFVVLSLVWNLPSDLSFIGLACFLPFLPVVRLIQSINDTRSPGAEKNESYSAANVGGIALGVVIFGLILVASMIPEPNFQNLGVP